MSNTSRIQGAQMAYRVIKYIPLKVVYTAGVPAIVANPENELITLTDSGVGALTVTLTTPSITPILVAGLSVECAAATLGLAANVDSVAAPSTTAVKIIVNSVADGVTETDPVAITMLLAVVRVA